MVWTGPLNPLPADAWGQIVSSTSAPRVTIGGQHEIGFRYAEPLTAADHHAVCRNAAVMGAATSQISYSAPKGGVLSMTREPVEMTSAVLFLASDDSSVMTANTVLGNGGISGAYVTLL
jgi:hypothetical protein